MSVYLVTWDLNKEGARYSVARTKVLTKLAAFGANKVKDPGLDTVWFVSTALTARQVYNHIGSALDTNDRLMVVKLTPGGYQGWLTAPYARWISARV